MTDSHGLRVLIRIQKYNPNRSPTPSEKVFVFVFCFLFFFFKVLIPFSVWTGSFKPTLLCTGGVHPNLDPDPTQLTKPDRN